MSENIQQKLNQNLYNIKLQIHDLELEKEEVKIKHYFDTSDVEESITGLSRFYNPSEDSFKKHLFDSEKTLVQCLAVSGNLNEIYLLPPHKAEFFNRLKFLTHYLDKRPDRRAEKFLINSGFADINWKELENNATYSSEIVNKIVEDSEQCENFFRTVYNLAPWHKRLEEVINERRLILDSNHDNMSSDFKYSDIFNSDYFPKLQKVIDFLRNKPEKSKNNLADAISIAILIEKLKTFCKRMSEGMSKNAEAPRFFASPNNNISIFLIKSENEIVEQVKMISQKKSVPDRIIKSIKEIQRLLNYSTSEGDINVFREESYFIQKAIIVATGNSLSKQERIDESLKKLNSQKSQIENFLLVSSKISQNEWVQNLEKDDIENVKNKLVSNTWVDIISKREKDWFFRNIWLNKNNDSNNSKAIVDFQSAVSDTITAYEDFRNRGRKELEDGINRVIGKIESRAISEVEDAKMIISLSEELNKKPSSNRKITDIYNLFKNDNNNLKEQFFYFFPIYRYSFPLDNYENVINFLKAFFDEKSSIPKSRLLVDYAQLLEHDDESDTNMEVDVDKLSETTAILYALKADKELQLLLYKLDLRFPHFSFQIVLAELNFELRKGTGRAKKIIEELKENFSNNEDVKEKRSLAVGIALLFYWHWKKKGGNSLWSESITTKKDNEFQEQIKILIDEAIKYTILASELSNEDEKAEKLYCQNLRLFFLTVSNDITDNARIEMNNLAKAMIGTNHEDKNWQFRYDDTLARYYGKLACVYSKDEVEMESNLHEAMIFLDFAKSKAQNDKIVQKTQRTLRYVKALINSLENGN